MYSRRDQNRPEIECLQVNIILVKKLDVKVTKISKKYMKSKKVT